MTVESYGLDFFTRPGAGGMEVLWGVYVEFALVVVTNVDAMGP